MTLAGMLFMAISWGFVLALCAYAFKHLLKK